MSGGLTTNNQQTNKPNTMSANKQNIMPDDRYTHTLEDIEFEHGSLSEMSDEGRAMIEFEYGVPESYPDCWRDDQDIDSPEE